MPIDRCDHGNQVMTFEPSRICARCLRQAAIVVCAIAVFQAASLPVRSAELGRLVEGFSEPYRTIHIAASEPGTVAEISVRLGDRVREGDVLAILDSKVYEALLEVAKAAREAQGELDAAKAEVKARQRRLDLFKALFRDQHASQEELDRAETDVAIARARLRSAEESRKLRALECDKLSAQLEARRIRAPQAGVVTKVAKQRGEYVGPNDPVVLTIVQLDPIAVTFLVPRSLALQFKIGAKATVRFVDSGREVTGNTEFVSPVTDAESGTVSVKVVIGNADGTLRAGERCQLMGSLIPAK